MVFIFNEDKCMLSGEFRLDVFSLSVANTSSTNEYKQCASHNGKVLSKAFVEESCTAVARYLLFRRNRGIETNWAGLCEVVVFGHVYISK